MSARGTALARLRTEVCAANQELSARGLARFTFGNVSGLDRDAGLVVIKPSGVAYSQLRPEMLVVVALDSGAVVEGDLRPSSDLPTHLELYRAFDGVAGVVHTHSHYATVWAQAQRAIPCLGTTHADAFHGDIPVTAHLSEAAIDAEYEANTGREIVRCLAGVDPRHMTAVLVAGHAPFCWGDSVHAAVDTAEMLEEVARMAYHTIALNAAAEPLPHALAEKHFTRKHGPAAYYGQPKPT
jgi:L-ribulose-5-phosphate 4-epimerase